MTSGIADDSENGAEIFLGSSSFWVAIFENRERKPEMVRIPKKKIVTSIDETCNAARDLRQRSAITSWQHFFNFGRKFEST